MRSQERALLVIPWLTVSLALFIVGRSTPYPVGYYIGGFFLLGALGHGLLLATAPESDQILFPVVYLLTGLGLAAILRIRPELAFRQFCWIFLGTIAVGAVNRFLPWKQLRYWKYSAATGGLTLLFLTALLGEEIGGARRWLDLGPVRFEPVEPVKILLVIFFAAYLADVRSLLTTSRRRFLGIMLPELRYLGPLLVMWLLFMFLLVAQKDLGAAFLFFGLFQALLFVATGSLGYLLGGMSLALAGGALAYRFFSHVRVRVAAWWNPWVRIDGGGYQIAQSLFALGGGGFWGTGWGAGQGAQAIPAVHTDFIYASLGEELGLLGCGAILFCYYLLLARSITIAMDQRDDFAQLLAAGIGFVLAIQVLVIIGGVIKMIPMTGITLPFISYGGSSLIASYLLVGILLAVSQGGRA
ncbi:MAG: FtsW/RodA/SpoVE family cell cycle protein [Limnochordia bacterium]|jgi:cell division protein FtsW (lipid II flippase)